ncbi:anti-repressor SinI family protein [Bacillus sp. IITD106]|nr:anti-repressor SinI family protein [Bacillus sp. IITD106]
MHILGGTNLGEEKEYIIEMDQEWLTLILEAKNMGFKKEEIRDFFRTKELKELISGR